MISAQEARKNTEHAKIFPYIDKIDDLVKANSQKTQDTADITAIVKQAPAIDKIIGFLRNRGYNLTYNNGKYIIKW